MDNDMNEPCKRCGVVHTCAPVDVDKIIKELGNEIAREIDAEVMRTLFSVPSMGSYRTTHK
jgi:hypothetical protein